MVRVKRGVTSKAKHNKLLSSTKGYRGTKSKLVRVAREAALHAGNYAFMGRKLKKRDFRSLWITRIGEAVALQGISYSAFIHNLKEKKISLDRKILSQILVEDPDTFKHIITTVKGK